MHTPVKIISVRQPWAWLICEGPKDIENRTWLAKYRGPLLIAASAVRPTARAWRAAADFALARGVTIPPRSALQFGGIVGAATLEDTVRSHASHWFEGPVGLVLANRRPVAFVPIKSQLKLFNAPETVLAVMSAHGAKGDVRSQPDVHYRSGRKWARPSASKQDSAI